jgi:NitT/TauT family transport system substrate-binding protein
VNANNHPSKYLMVLAILACAFMTSACVREPEPPLRIGTNVWIGSEPLYLAQELGYLDLDRVRLVEYPSASEVLRAYRNQAIDGMVISFDEVFGLSADGQQPRIILAVDLSHGADVVVGRSGMLSLNDLKGKKVAVESGALGAYVWSRALAINGMQAGDVEVVHLESNEHPKAFQKGQVDGAVTFDPFRAKLLSYGGVTLFDSTQIPGEIVDLLAVRASVLQKQPKAIQSLLKGWFRAVDYVNREPNDAAMRMGVRQQTSGEQFLQTLKGIRIPSREENLKMLGGTSPELVGTGDTLMALMLEAKLLSAPVKVEELLAPEPLRNLPP